MSTINNLKTVISESVNRSLPEETTQLQPEDVKDLLKIWLNHLKDPSPPENSLKGLKIRENQKTYFDLLEQGIEGIFEREDLPPSPLRSYLQEICSKNNPYDFAASVEQAVAGILNFEEKSKEENDKQITFVLYYFHRRQLEDAASKKWFLANKQIGRIWA